MNSKYGNVRISVNGELFDSKREAKRYGELKLLERAGIIKHLRRQVKYELIPKVDDQKPIYYIADFVYEENGKTVVEDAKGMRTDVYKMKKKLIKWRYGIDIRET